MRLIDADKLPYVSKVILVDQLDGDVIIMIAKEYTSYVNDETPTVEAIPIKWIKNYASHKASKDLIDCYWHFWEDDVLKMIADWEKEQSESLE